MMKFNLDRLKKPDAVGFSSSSMAFILRGPTSQGSGMPEDFLQNPDAEIPDASFPPVDTGVEIPNDTLAVTGAAVFRVQPRVDDCYYDSYNHDLPMSYAFTVRYFLGDKVAVATGLTLTKYRSTSAYTPKSEMNVSMKSSSFYL